MRRTLIAPLPLPRAWLVLAAAGIPLFGLLDVRTGAELSLSAFYLLCVLVITASGGRAAGVLAAFGAACAGIAGDIFLLGLADLGWQPYWNAAQRAFVYLVAALIVGRLMITVAELQRALAEIRTLQGLLSMCAWCRRIREEDGSWKTVERYVVEHTDASITHGICPTCAERVSAGP